MLANMELPEGSKLRSFWKKGSISSRDAVVHSGPEVLSEQRKRQVSLYFGLNAYQVPCQQRIVFEKSFLSLFATYVMYTFEIVKYFP